MKFEKTKIVIGGVELVVKSSDGYSLIIETTRGDENHFWLDDGQYDGHSSEVKELAEVEKK